MTKTNPKREAALALLAATGMRRSNYEPPSLKLLWKLGIDAPPPHMASFMANALFSGTYFGVCWGLVMWFGFWSGQGRSIESALLATLAAAVPFGLFMGVYYRHGRRIHGLPLWKDLRA